MKSIHGLALRFFAKNKFTAASSILSVMISVTLVITMMLFVNNAKESLRHETKQMYGEMDLSIGYNANQNKNIDKDQLSYITSIKEIEKVSKVFITRVRLDTLESAEIYTVGVENDSLAKSKYHFTQDLRDSGVIMNRKLADAIHVNANDTVSIGNKPYSVIEVIPDREAAGIIPDILIMSHSTVHELVFQQTHHNSEASYVLIKLMNDADRISVTNAIFQQYPDIRIDVAQQDEYIRSNLVSLNVFLIVMSILILFITSLIIMANFEIYLYKYRNQLAIMRALGASTKQLYRIVVIQSFMISITGGIAGLILSYASSELLQGYLGKLFSIQLGAGNFRIIPSLLLMAACVTTVQFFLLLPSYRLAKVLPLRIMRENENLDFNKLKARKKMGKYALFTSLILNLIAILGYVFGETPGLPVILLSTGLFIVSMVLLFPVYISAVIGFLLPAIKAIFGRTSYVAVKTIMPQIKKNSLVMLSITIMMMISIFGSATLQTVSQGNERYLKKQFVTDVLAVSRIEHDSGINHRDLHQSIIQIPGVTAVSEISTPYIAELFKDDKRISFDYILGNLKEMSSQGILPPLDGKPKNTIILTEAFAKQNHIRVGDVIEIGLYSVQTQSVIQAGGVNVSAILKELPGSPLSALIDWENAVFNNNFTRFKRAFIQTEDSAQVLKNLESLKSKYPELQFNSLEQSIQQSREMYRQRMSIFIVFLFVILLSVMLGVFGTLINNIYSKRKEFAILRTMSIGSNGLIKVILTQVMLYIVLGVVFGTIMGIVTTLMMNLIDPQVGLVTFDFTNVAAIVLVMIIVGAMIFVPYASRLSKRKIAIEITHDNK